MKEEIHVINRHDGPLDWDEVAKQSIKDVIKQRGKRKYYAPPNYKFEHKGKLRNNPCPCGSDKKFKLCCWDVLGE